MNRISHPLFRLMILNLLLGLSAACSHDHRVHIDPELYVQPREIGQGTLVQVTVADRRTRRAIYEKDAGPRTALVGSLNKVNIYPSGSVGDPIRDRVVQGLESLGFRTVKQDQKAERLLKVQVLHLRMIYNFEDPKLRIPGKEVRLKTALGVIAKKPGKQFKRLYQTHLDKSQNLLTGEFKNEQFINNGISLTLQKMFEDPALLYFLAPEK